MCTSIAFPERELYGRNLDLEYHFGEKVVVTPRSHAFAFRHIEPLERHYAMIGMASVAEDTPLYAEAVLVEDGVIRQVGSREALFAQKRADTRLVDL